MFFFSLPEKIKAGTRVPKGIEVLMLVQVLHLAIGVHETRIVKHRALRADTDCFFNYLSYGFVLTSKTQAMDLW